MLFVSKHTIWCENETYLRVLIITVPMCIFISFISKWEQVTQNKFCISPVKFEFRRICNIIYIVIY